MARDEALIATRSAIAADAPFLEAMLLAALNWDPTRPALTPEAAWARPEIRHYVDGWPRHDDIGVLAEVPSGTPVGAAWLRFHGSADPGYGFVEDGIPEVTLGVVSERRGRGIGTRLLTELEAAARRRGIEALSLSVEPANPAVRLYRRRGYTQVGRSGGAQTLRLDL